MPERPPAEDFDEAAYFDRFIDDGDDGPAWSVKFLARHYQTFRERRHLPNVALFHFAELSRRPSGRD